MKKSNLVNKGIKAVRNKNKKAISDLEECKLKVLATLREYNCELMSADEWSQVLIRDKDTDKTVHWEKGE
jgi:hypothetical protein